MRMGHQLCANNRRRNRGTLLIEALIGSLILMLATVTILSLVTMTKRGQKMSEDKTKAVQMLANIVDQVQMLPADQITDVNLVGLNLVDAGGVGTSLTFNNVPLDDQYGYSASDVFIDPATSLNIGTLSDGTKRIDVQLSYTSASGETQTVKSGTYVGYFR